MRTYLGRRRPFWRGMWIVAGCYVCVAGTAGGRIIAGIWGCRRCLLKLAGEVCRRRVARCMGLFQGRRSGQDNWRERSSSLVWLVLGRLHGGFCWWHAVVGTRQKAVAQ